MSQDWQSNVSTDSRDPVVSPGRTRSERRCDEFTLGECICNGPMPRSELHLHERAFFRFIVSGSYSERIGSLTVSYRPFSTVFWLAGFVHEDTVGENGSRCFRVELEQSLVERMHEDSLELRPYADLHGGELAWLVARLYREYRAGGLGSRLVAEGLVLEMLGTAARAPARDVAAAPAWLARAVDLLHSSYKYELSVNRIACEVGVHPVHLSRVFRFHKRVSIPEFVHRLRVREACIRLADPDATITDVALSVGFADQSHLTRVFKQVTGVTPGVFRSVYAEDKTQAPRKAR
jgi:AraC family transcriptional regulator